jgi:hypothetical protein
MSCQGFNLGRGLDPAAYVEIHGCGMAGYLFFKSEQEGDIPRSDCLSGLGDLTPEQLLENFFSAKQQKGENITQWGCCLSGLAREAIDAGASSSESRACSEVNFHNILKPEFDTSLRMMSHMRHSCVMHSALKKN